LTIQNALFEILDSDQNHAVKDLFLKEFDHDFSNIWSIIAINDDSRLHPALKSRLDIIEVQEYTNRDVMQIVRNYLIPQELKNLGIPPNSIQIDDPAVHVLIDKAKKFASDPVDIRIVKNNLVTILSHLNTQESNRISSKNATKHQCADFNGFPYTITRSTIYKIIKDKINPFQNMYA